jgi:predicted RNA-binding Zn-ribbon protein involved in translation (DUF1610 family)
MLPSTRRELATGTAFSERVWGKGLEEIAMKGDSSFTVACPECGDVEVDNDQLWLVVTAGGMDHYDFHCPTCRAHVMRPADDEVFELLAPLVAVEVLDVPAEALEPHLGPALTVDDLIDLMLELERLPVS